MRRLHHQDRTPRQITTLVAIILLISAGDAFARPSSPFPPIEADAWLIMSARTGHILGGRNTDEQYPPGSLTKLMTAYLTFEAAEAGRIGYTDHVRISEREWRMSGSQMFVEVDERITVDRLLQGMLVAGGNDAAHALARHAGIRVDSFVDLMNTRARSLGMRNTHFVTPSGLPDPDQLTTARDMAILARALIREFPDQYRRFSVRAISHNGIRQRNRNPVLGIVRGADGLLTGYTDRAGYNLVASAQREDMRLIAVLLGASTPGDRLQGAARGLRHGFRHFTTVRVAEAHHPIERARVWKGRSDFVTAILKRDLYVTISNDRLDSMQTRTRFPHALEAPLTTSEQIGSFEVVAGAELVARAPLFAANAVATAGWMDYAVDTIRLQWREFWRAQRRELFARDTKDTDKKPRG